MKRECQRGIIAAVFAASLTVVGVAKAGNLDPTNAPGPTMHTLEDIYQKVHNLAPQALQTLSATSDVVRAGYYVATNLTLVATNLVAGNIRKGVTLFGITGTFYSSGVTNRYWDHGNGTVTDQETGLMWMRSANIAGKMTWSTALTFCDNLVTNGYSDWRLPSVNRQDGPGGPMGNAELDTLFRANGNPSGAWEGFQGTPFTDIQSDYYSSSTTYSGSSSASWVVIMDGGVVNYGVTKTFPCFVWPVRGGQ